MGSIFITYGAKAGGGPAFLKRQRSSVGQIQTRTSTATATSQLQTRTRSGSSRAVYGYQYDVERIWECGYASILAGPICDSYLFADAPAGNVLNCRSYNSSVCSYAGCSQNWECELRLKSIKYFKGYTCSFNSWSAWSNVSSCSTSFPGCPNTQRDCRNLINCSFGTFTGWSNTSSCTPVSPACSNGAVKRECQTLYSWGDWSAYEEVDVCSPTNPSLGAGAIQVECVPQ